MYAQLILNNEKYHNALVYSCLAAQMAYELQTFMKEKGLNPFKNLMVPLIQVCVLFHKLISCIKHGVDYFYVYRLQYL